MASIIVKIFLTEEFQKWSLAFQEVEAIYEQKGLAVRMVKKVVGQNSVVLVLDGQPKQLLDVFKDEKIQASLSELVKVI